MRPIQLLLLSTFGLLLVACGSNSNDVPSLAATPTPGTANEELDDEAWVMEFTECLRSEGIPVNDPTVDADGNIQLPELAEGETITREEWGEAYAVCGHLIEGLSFEREENANLERFEQFLPIATCLNEKGYDVGEPTAENIQIWLEDFRVEFDWDDPDAAADYEECASQK